MAIIIGINSRHGLRIELNCRNQITKTKLVLYKLLLSLLESFDIMNKKERFSYKA